MAKRDEPPWVNEIDDEIGRWFRPTAASGKDAEHAARNLVTRLRQDYPDKYQEWAYQRAWRELRGHVVAARKNIADAQAKGR